MRQTLRWSVYLVRQDFIKHYVRRISLALNLLI